MSSAPDPFEDRLVSSDGEIPAAMRAARSALDWADICSERCSDKFVLSTEVMSDSMSSRKSPIRLLRTKSKSRPNQRS